MNKYITPNWPAPHHIKAYTTTRTGGFSNPPYDSYNFNLLVGDNTEDVLKNREKLVKDLNLPNEPFWLKQEHTNLVINIEKNHSEIPIVADASFSARPKDICAVMTADCIPILVCDNAGSIVAAIHAGWKGIANGVISNTIEKMDTDPQKLLAWLGPAIGPDAFMVSKEFQNNFIEQNPKNSISFIKNKDLILTNIYLLAKIALESSGVSQIYGGEYCTFSQQDIFYSYRRDGEKTGRMASLIWIDKHCPDEK